MAPQWNYDTIFVPDTRDSRQKVYDDSKENCLLEVLDPNFQHLRRYIQYSDKNEPTLWIFGYGSLIWLPKFEYSQYEAGYIEGYARRFWQGNSTHRGTPGSPGRVATLVKDKHATKTWGVSYLLKGSSEINEALRHLCNREVTLGGYKVKQIDFHFRETKPGTTNSIKTVTFVATEESNQYLGPAPVEILARTIVNSRGKSGHNLEYLFMLVDKLREIVPECRDHHLESLEDACHRLINLKCLQQIITHDRTDDEILTEDDYVLYCHSTRNHLIRESLHRLSPERKELNSASAQFCNGRPS